MDAKVTSYGWKTLAGSAIGYAMDGFDLLILGFMLRAIAADLGLSPAQSASLVTATLIGAVLGGVGSLWGPAVGALILIPLAELSRSYLGGSGSGADLIIYGTLIMVVSLMKPEGLLGLFRKNHAKGAAT